MNIGVIGSGSIGPDLAYGFGSALSRGKPGKVYLLGAFRPLSPVDILPTYRK